MDARPRRRVPPLWLLMLLFIVVYGSLSVGLTAACSLPWTVPLPAAVGLSVGIPLLVVGFGLYGWSVKSLGLRRMFGKELFKPAAESALITTGAFAHSRNPIYFAITVMLLGWFLVSLWTPLAVMTVLAFTHFMFVARWEQRELAERFGQAYLDYKRRVPFFLPRLRRPGGKTESSDSADDS